MLERLSVDRVECLQTTGAAQNSRENASCVGRNVQDDGDIRSEVGWQPGHHTGKRLDSTRRCANDYNVTPVHVPNLPHVECPNKHSGLIFGHILSI